MFIPIVPHTTVINKTIVYSDTVLNLKDLGDNIKVTSISDVDEFSFEFCLKKVFESNPGVTFNTIQYSKENKKIYFYTLLRLYMYDRFIEILAISKYKHNFILKGWFYLST